MSRRQRTGRSGGKDTFLHIKVEGVFLYEYHCRTTITMLMSSPPKERRNEYHWRNVYGIVNGEMQFIKREEPEQKTRKIEASEIYLEWPKNDNQ